MKSLLHVVVRSFNSIGKHLLAAGRLSSAVELGLCPTHVMCNRQARRILETDGHAVIARLLDTFQNDLDLGVCWPDSNMAGLGCVNHFYHAKTGNGLLGSSPADVSCRRYFLNAVKFWRRGDYRKAMFCLGAAAHYVQDVCEPHHANCYVGMGHRQYEEWAVEHRDDYAVRSSGIYRNYQDIDKRLKECARISYDLLDLVTEKSGVKYYQQATEHLLPLAQRATAGFFLSFFKQVGFNSAGLSELELLKAS